MPNINTYINGLIMSYIRKKGDAILIYVGINSLAKHIKDIFLETGYYPRIYFIWYICQIVLKNKFQIEFTDRVERKLLNSIIHTCFNCKLQILVSPPTATLFI